jgi:hypothetical protein
LQYWWIPVSIGLVEDPVENKLRILELPSVVPGRLDQIRRSQATSEITYLL